MCHTPCRRTGVPVLLATGLLAALLLAACGGGGDEGTAAPPPAAVDTQAPTVQISASALQFTAAGTLRIDATATDDVGVTALEFYDGAVRIAADAGNANRAQLAFTANDNGSHRITAIVRDAAGHATTSTALNVTVAIPVAQPSQRQLKKSFLSLDGKQTVWYWEYLPAGYDGSQPYPCWCSSTARARPATPTARSWPRSRRTARPS
jgi:chitinase